MIALVDVKSVVLLTVVILVVLNVLIYVERTVPRDVV